MYLCGPGKHNCQPFCGPEGRFYCSDSVCSLWPAPFSYLCVSVMILCVCWKLCGWTSKNWLLPYACCGLHFIDSAACVLSFDHSTPLQLVTAFAWAAVVILLLLPSTSVWSFYSEELAAISHLQYEPFAHTRTLANAVTYVSFITVHRLP